jgi:predicted DNA-binding transcriptional regulator AlpA
LRANNFVLSSRYALLSFARNVTEAKVLDELKVYSKRETQKLIGLSGRTWDRLEARGETPPKTRLSLNRIGYRADHLRQWLDARRETEAA